MPPLTDNQREAELRRRVRNIQDAFPRLSHGEGRARAIAAMDDRAHLRGKWRRG